MVAGVNAKFRTVGRLCAAVLVAAVLVAQPFVPVANFLGVAHAAAALDPMNVYVGSSVTEPTHDEGTAGKPFTSLPAAYAAVTAGGKIHVMPGTIHQPTNLTISKQVTIDGQPGAKVTTSGTANIFTIAAVGTVISDVTFQKTDSATQNMIGVQASNVVIKDNTFSGQYALGADEVSRAMVTSSGAFNTIITGNTINNLRQPAYLNDGSGGSITGNYLNQSRGWVVEKSSFFSFSNNTWGTNAVDIAIIPGAGAGANNYPCAITNALTLQNNGATVQNQVANCFVDTAAPSVPTGGQPHAKIQKTNTFDFTWNESTDDQPGNVSYEFQSSLNLAQSGGVLTTGLWKSGTLLDPKILSTGAPDGKWYWQVRAVDAAGNKSAWSPIWNVTLYTVVDTKKPVVELTSPQVGSFNPPSIIVNATDNLGLNKVTANIYDKDNKVLKKSCSKTATPEAATSYTLNCAVSGLDDGIYTIRANASDMAGNVSQTLTRQFAIDNTVPVIVHTSEGSIPAIVTGTQTFTFAITEKYPALITAALNDGPKEPQDAPMTMQEFPEGFDSINVTTNVDTTKLQDGANKLAIEVTDYAGNKAEKVVNFIVKNNPDTNPPGEEPPTEEPPVDEPGEGENGGNTPAPGENSSNGGSSTPQPIELIAAFNGGSPTNNNAGSFTAPAPTDSTTQEEPSSEPEDGEVLGTQTNPDTSNNASNNKSQEGIAWYWWLALGGGGLAAWLGIAALSRKLRGGEA